MHLGLFEWVVLLPHAVAAAAPAGNGGATTPNPAAWIATLIAAVIAAAAAITGAVLQRKSGIEAATAARTSAAAAQRSAAAAEEAVRVNERTATGVALRAEADARSKRYQEAAAQLGSPSPAVRMAGVYAMASLADDWPEQQQACIDVLCSYLQMPWLDDAPAAYLAERHVRRAVVQSIGRRLGSAGVGWSSRDFDFSDARLVDIRFENCHFGGQVSFARAVFEGNCLLAGLTFERGAAFAASEVAGTLTLDRLQTVHPAGLSFEGAVVDVGAELRVVAGVSEADRGRHPRLDRLIVRGLLSVQLPASQVVQPPLSLDWVDVEGGRVRMDVPLRVTKNRAVAHRPRVHARDWVLKDGCEIDIPQKLIDDDVVSFGSVLRPMEIPATATLTFRIAGDDRAD